MLTPCMRKNSPNTADAAKTTMVTCLQSCDRLRDRWMARDADRRNRSSKALRGKAAVMLRAAHHIEAPRRFQLLTRKSSAQSEGRIISSSARAHTIRGDRANGLTQKIASGRWLALAVPARGAGSPLPIPLAAIDSKGRTIWIADAHRDDGNRFVVHAG